MHWLYLNFQCTLNYAFLQTQYYLPLHWGKIKLLCLQTLYLTFDISFRENYKYVKCCSIFYVVLNILQESTLEANTKNVTNVLNPFYHHEHAHNFIV